MPRLAKHSTEIHAGFNLDYRVNKSIPPYTMLYKPTNGFATNPL